MLKQENVLFALPPLRSSVVGCFPTVCTVLKWPLSFHSFVWVSVEDGFLMDGARNVLWLDGLLLSHATQS